MPNKERERFYLEALRRTLRDAPSGSPSEPEPPDFVFVNVGHRVGIELTTLHLPPDPGKPSHQEVQSLKNQVVAQAELFHAGSGGSALYVGVFFLGHQRLRKKDIQPFARELAETLLVYPVPQHIDQPAITIPWEYRPRWTAGIHVAGSVNGVDKLWHADAGGWVARVTSEHISDVVKSKASREPVVFHAWIDAAA